MHCLLVLLHHDACRRLGRSLLIRHCCQAGRQSAAARPPDRTMGRCCRFLHTFRLWLFRCSVPGIRPQALAFSFLVQLDNSCRQTRKCLHWLENQRIPYPVRRCPLTGKAHQGRRGRQMGSPRAHGSLPARACRCMRAAAPHEIHPCSQPASEPCASSMRWVDALGHADCASLRPHALLQIGRRTSLKKA